MPMKTKTCLFLAFLDLSAVGLKAKAVSPPPDGGYLGGNTDEAQNALLSLITGTYNTAIGVFSLESDTTGRFKTATGAGALLANIADENTATGAGALLSNTVGANNTANGAFGLFSNTTGSGNIALGASAGVNLTTGSDNIDIGNSGVAGESDSIRIGTGQTTIFRSSAPIEFLSRFVAPRSITGIAGT